MAVELDRLSQEAHLLAERLSVDNPELADIIRTNAESLSVSAELIRAAGVELNGIVEETSEQKKARILALEDPFKKYAEVLSIVRPPSPGELATLRELGYGEFTIRTDSLRVLVTQDRKGEYFEYGQMDHLNTYPPIRDFSSPVNFLVGIHLDPERIYIQDSRNRSQEVQAEMVEELSQKQIIPVLPDALAIMLPSTFYTQRDRAFFLKQETKGQKLFNDFRARGIERLASGDSFAAGRLTEEGKFLIHRYESKGYDSIVAVPAIVLI